MFEKEFNKGCMLIVGGAKSGKSSFALKVCDDPDKKKFFFATARAMDREMEERIKRHKLERGDEWTTIEEPLDLAEAIESLDGEDTVMLLDCLTLWVNNLYMEYENDRPGMEKEMERLIKGLSNIKGKIVIVSNEVGSGIVPENELGRIYRDDIGLLNQKIAAISRKVVTVMAGIPLVLKDE